MDVSLAGRRVFRVTKLLVALLSLGLISCGNRYDLSTENGRQSRIDDANFHLSRGECSAADEAINPLYASPYVTEEARLVKASAQACFARFQLLNFAANIVGASNYFQAMAKSLDNTPGDDARTWMNRATDVMTQNSGAIDAGQRSRTENTYMVFLQFGVISSILRNYGSPDSSGNQHTDLSYPAGNMSNVDACALTAAFSLISDSMGNANLTDSDSTNIANAMNSVCVAAGVSSCAALNRDRNACDGSNTNSVKAGTVATSVNSAW